MKILIAEDDLSCLQLLESLVLREGHSSVSTCNGSEALRLYIETRPDVVIANVALPGLGGLDILSRIREEDRATFVLLLNNKESEDDVIAAIRFGASHYFRKPIGKDDFQTALRSYSATLAQRHSGVGTVTDVAEDRLELNIQTKASIVPSVADFLSTECAMFFTPQEQIEVRTGLQELLMNAVEHGNMAIGFDEKTNALQNNTLEELYLQREQNPLIAQRTVQISYWKQGDRCTWTIVDEGAGFCMESLPPSNPETYEEHLHGKGICICRAYFDSLHYTPPGNRVEAVKLIAKR